MSLNLGVILQATALQYPERPLLHFEDEVMSYGEVDRAARGIATALHDRGVRPGDHVAVMLPNIPQFPIAYFGILYAGATVVPLNVLLTADEVEYHLQDSESKLLFATPLFESAASEGARRAAVPVVWSDGAEGPTMLDLAECDPLWPIHPTNPDDTAVILYTSGTTGRPKGAELTHSNLTMNATNVMPRVVPATHEDVGLATLPLFHTFGQTFVQNGLISVGGSLVLLQRFSPEEALRLIEHHRVTMFAGVPTMYFGLLHYPDRARFDASSLRYAVTGGAPMPVEVMNEFERAFPVHVLEGYGLSETSPLASFNTFERPRKVGSIGYPLWGIEMAILDEQNRPVADGERGEICIRGHSIMKGYYRRPDATEEAFRGGWFHSGDVGIRDEDGCYFIVDRVKDMIIRGGYNVYPREIEEVLYAHPAVAEAAVIGVPDEQYGEEVKAFVALAPGQSAEADQIIAYTKEHLAAYKYPRSIEFLETLPKGPTGKILKRELR